MAKGQFCHLESLISDIHSTSVRQRICTRRRDADLHASVASDDRAGRDAQR